MVCLVQTEVRQPARACDLAVFLCGPSHDLGINQCVKDKHLLILRNVVINMYTLPKHEGKQSRAYILTKQNFVDVGL
jgi:hypothetical protein